MRLVLVAWVFAIPVLSQNSLEVSPTDFKLEIDKAGNSNMIKVSSDNITGKINGGGLEINLNSTHNNVYLRKK